MVVPTQLTRLLAYKCEFRNSVYKSLNSCSLGYQFSMCSSISYLWANRELYTQSHMLTNLANLRIQPQQVHHDFCSGRSSAFMVSACSGTEATMAPAGVAHGICRGLLSSARFSFLSLMVSEEPSRGLMFGTDAELAKTWPTAPFSLPNASAIMPAAGSASVDQGEGWNSSGKPLSLGPRDNGSKR